MPMPTQATVGGMNNLDLANALLARATGGIGGVNPGATMQGMADPTAGANAIKGQRVPYSSAQTPKAVGGTFSDRNQGTKTAKPQPGQGVARVSKTLMKGGGF